MISLVKQQKLFLDDDYIIVRQIQNKICGITIDGFKDRHYEKIWSDNFILKYLPNFELKSLQGIEPQWYLDIKNKK